MFPLWNGPAPKYQRSAATERDSLIPDCQIGSRVRRLYAKSAILAAAIWSSFFPTDSSGIDGMAAAAWGAVGTTDAAMVK